MKKWKSVKNFGKTPDTQVFVDPVHIMLRMRSYNVRLRLEVHVMLRMRSCNVAQAVHVMLRMRSCNVAQAVHVMLSMRSSNVGQAIQMLRRLLMICC